MDTIHISTLANTADNYINSPKLEIIKNSYSQNVNNKTNAVQKGETIIYEIKVKNTGNIPASHIKISDTISNKVTVVAIEDNGVLENGKITWI